MAFALLTIVAILADASADVYRDGSAYKEIFDKRVDRSYDTSSHMSGCLYDGKWYANGASVSTRESCLRCVCARTALSCSRRACAPLPDPPPKRCHVRHRRGVCCPELHCPDVVINMEHEASARSELDDFSDIITPPTLGHACVEGGTIYAAGSAMSSNVACEQCFCLKGMRKCVRPSCLPSPPHCAPRPTAGACCPQRYYCEYDNRQVLENSYDCKVNGRTVREGERVPSSTNCTACYCLGGGVRCRRADCAPALHGCEPVLRRGECCAHQYNCQHDTTTNTRTPVSKANTIKKYSSVISERTEDRALHTKNMSKLLEITTKRIVDELYTAKKRYVASATKNDINLTTKVKRKTDENSFNVNEKVQNDTKTLNNTTPKNVIAEKVITTKVTKVSSEITTEQPDKTVKIVINGTINCTAELSSTSLPLSITNDTDRIQMESLPRVPMVNGIEAQTYSPNDIITDRSVNGDFDENETFTINVTSSLNAKTNTSNRPVLVTTSKTPTPVDLVKNLNSSKKTKGDYDYDYIEPTLPPSLPNLKIIPFVAADAVVDDEPPKDTLRYPILEREDKFPVYYPTDSKENSFTRREDIYHPTQYPVFISNKEPVYNHDMGLTNNRYHYINDHVREYTVSTSLGSLTNEGNTVTKETPTSPTFEMKTPAVNMFSPPVETEGGFIPKGPGIIDEYYAAYPSTPSGPAVPHLTTSMQLDISKAECVTDDGEHIPEGDSFNIGCTSCVCSWGQLRCAPPLCRAPAGCHFTTHTADSKDQCCGDIICEPENSNSSINNAPMTEKSKTNDTKGMTSTTGTIQASQPQNADMERPFYNVNKSDIIEKQNITNNIDVKDSSHVINNITKMFMTDSDNVPNTTAAINVMTSKPIYTKEPITASSLDTKTANYTSTEYDEDDDEGFSFGSVLKLLLSDSYDTSSKAPPKSSSSLSPLTNPSVPTTTTTWRPPSTINQFIPLPSLPHFPPMFTPATVNRIDHLILGEATAIKTTTPRPITNKTTKPLTVGETTAMKITTPRPTTNKTTKPPTESTTERTTERPDVNLEFTSGPRPPNLGGSGLPGIGAELLRLAGCNIYGRMYRVGRIIAELSTACEECWCTESGVQCKPLRC